MENQLDEDLAGNAKSPVAIFPVLLKSFLIYILILCICFVVYYAIGESAGLLGKLSGGQTFGTLFLEEGITLLLWTIVFLIPGHYLQNATFHLFDKSIIKNAFIPFTFWFVLLLSSFLLNFIEGMPPLKEVTEISLTFGGVFCWYFLLCLLISWYLKHQNKAWYLGTFFAHWFVFSLLTVLYHSSMLP